MAQASSEGGRGSGIKAACMSLPWETILRVFGGCLGILIMILGFVGIFTTAFDLRNFVNECYQVIFGALIILSELRLERWLKFFTFLTSYTGLGLFYIFVGGLALGGAWYEYVLAICFLAVGIVYFNYGCCMRKSMYVKGDPNAPAGAPQAQELKPAVNTPSTAFPSSQVRPPGGSNAYANVSASVARAAPASSVQINFDDQAESAWPEMDQR